MNGTEWSRWLWTLLQGSLGQELQSKMLWGKTSDVSTAVWFQLGCWRAAAHPLDVLSETKHVNVG